MTMKRLITLAILISFLFGCSSMGRLEDTAIPPTPPSGWKIVSGVITPVNSSTTVSIPTVATGMVVVSDGDGIVLTSADFGKTIWMTGAGEVQLPDAGSSDIGKYFIIIVRDASEQVEVALTDATELIVDEDGTEQTAGYEADMLTSAMSKITIAYMETGKWYVISGFVTDGGAAD